jgi:hypothetical protein
MDSEGQLESVLGIYLDLTLRNMLQLTETGSKRETLSLSRRKPLHDEPH